MLRVQLDLGIASLRVPSQVISIKQLSQVVKAYLCLQSEEL